MTYDHWVALENQLQGIREQIAFRANLPGAQDDSELSRLLMARDKLNKKLAKVDHSKL